MGIILSLLSSYWKQIGVAVIVLGALITAGVYRGLYHHEKTLYTALTQELEAQSKAAEAHAKAVESQQAEINLQTKESYDKQIADLRKYYANHPNVEWLRNTPPECVLPVIPDTPKGTHAKAKGNATADTRATEAIQVNPADAAEDVLTLLKLQEWVKKQGEVK